MAKGQNTTVTVTLNNKKAVTSSKSVEMVLKNGVLVPDNNELEPGVNTRTM